MLRTRTFSVMVKYLVLCFCFCVISQLQVVLSLNEVREIQKKIDVLKGQAKVLEEENKSLSQTLAKARQECQAELVSLKNSSHLDKDLEDERLLLAELSNDITEKKAEEELVLNALSQAYLTNKKYYLKVELLSHDLELFQLRRKEGIDKHCWLSKPLIGKYNSSLGFRSLVKWRNSITEKASLLRFKVEYEAQMSLVKKITSSNEFLKFQINNEAKMCNIEKNNFQNAINMTQDALLSIKEDKEIFQEEFDDVSKHLQNLYTELREIQDKTGQDKANAEDLRNQLKDFDKDRECYVEIFNANVVFE